MARSLRLTRRRFVATTGLGALSIAGLPLARAGASDWAHLFARGLEANPALLGWRGVRADALECTARIEGRLPDALRGTFYRNGPAVHERFGVRYQHLFDGDGMVQAYRFDGRGVTHRARVLATESSYERPRPGAGCSRDSERRSTARWRCAAPTTSIPPTSPCSTTTARCSRCGRGALRACSTATPSSGGASRCGGRPRRDADD